MELMVDTQGQNELENKIKETNSCTFIWTNANTLILLQLYKKFRSKVGTLQIRNFKKMWEAISVEFNKIYKINVSPSNCENRWRVLERNYKKYVNNKNQTGTVRKYFEYAKEMEDILGKKKNIRPTVLLSNDTISNLPNQETALTSDTLQQIRHDKNERHREKIKLEKERFDKLYELKLRKLEAKEKKNCLLQEGNKIRKETNKLLLQILKDMS